MDARPIRPTDRLHSEFLLILTTPPLTNYDSFHTTIEANFMHRIMTHRGSSRYRKKAMVPKAYRAIVRTRSSCCLCSTSNASSDARSSGPFWTSTSE